MANFVHHEPCPDCGSRDNLARYDDGSAYCFGCGRYERPTNAPQKALKRPTRPFPDLVDTLPARNRDWLLERGLTLPEIDAYFQYAPELDRHVFMDFYNVGYIEARSVTGGQPKVLSYGVKPYLPIVSKRDTYYGWFVFVEDAISAIKVARYVDAIPLFGSNIPGPVFARYANMGYNIAIWLDYDKFKNSLEFVKRFTNMGVYARPICTKEDPKDVKDLAEILSNHLTVV